MKRYDLRSRGAGGGASASSSSAEPAAEATPPIKRRRGKNSLGGRGDTQVDEKPSLKRAISDPQEMFLDMVRHAPKPFLPSVRRVKRRRPLRVATMCSGTESPILAFERIIRAVEEVHGESLRMEHVFSCEIEPWKQAYIEANLAPPLLFRDIRELSEGFACTAYGGIAEVPDRVDILIAGTSCVDNSTLNRERQDGQSGGGESAQTYQGMMRWIKKSRPRVVLQENVCGAPWGKMKADYEKLGYRVDFMRVDTKNYYIPHTRLRGYLFAVDADVCDEPNAPEMWKENMRLLERKSSSSLEDFMLPPDDPRVNAARIKLALESEDKEGVRGDAVDWSRCESRHQRERAENNLGTKRPLTGWSEDGTCRFPDYGWNIWGEAQVDRVNDVLDVNYLRAAVKGFDAQYKTLVWNPGQNVDRQEGGQLGTTPCLCPKTIAFVTTRGGPLSGIETLGLQGLPVEDLILTRMTDRQLKDLAGNAMTSTVVGAGIVSSVIVAAVALAKTWPASHDSPAKTRPRLSALENRSPLKVDGVHSLEDHPSMCKIGHRAKVKHLLDAASKSARFCVCEGRSGMQPDIFRCKLCGHTACSECRGNPEHVYEKLTRPRMAPERFLRMLTEALPARLLLRGFSESKLNRLRPDEDKVAAELWTAWCAAMACLEDAEFRLRRLQRAQVWHALYDGPDGAKLELILDGEAPEWHVSLVPPAEVGPLREALLMPVARMKVAPLSNQLLKGPDGWEVMLPVERKFKATVTGHGGKTPAWEAKLGLQGKYANKRRWKHLELQVAKADAAALDMRGSPAGKYELLEKCGGALGSLHKCMDRHGLFLFFDPDRVTEHEQDSFVVARDAHRRDHGESRVPILRFDPKWRPSSEAKPEEVKCKCLGCWEKITASFDPSILRQLHLCLRSASDPWNFTYEKACSHAAAIVSCSVPLEGDDLAFPSRTWETVALTKNAATWNKLSWILHGIRYKLPEFLKNWISVRRGRSALCSRCELCAPSAPPLEWVNTGSGKLVPRESPQAAAVYERMLKARPEAFVLDRRRHDRVGHLRLSINPGACLHRAHALLGFSNCRVTLTWRLVEHRQDDSHVLSPLEPRSNRRDKPCAQPRHFKRHDLRQDQLRSLGWMCKQEECTEPFAETEVVEAVFKQLDWRLEATAKRFTTARGGIIADQVGYGKTAVTIGLIDRNRKNPASSPAPSDGRVPTKATLVLVPSHLMDQWPKEFKKFVGVALKVVCVFTMADLNRLTIKDITRTDVLVVATSVLRVDRYYQRLKLLAGLAKELPNQGGRLFSLLYKEVMQCLLQQVNALANERTGPKAVANRVREAIQRHDDHTNGTIDTVLKLGTKQKRLVAGASLLKGKKATHAAEKKPGKKLTRNNLPTKRGRSDVTRCAKGCIDAWGLDEAEVNQDWTLMRSPPLELFSWHRVVVDEFTYIARNSREHVAITQGISTDCRWCLSGTPPLKDFDDIKFMAGFVGINLGIDAPSQPKLGRGARGQDRELTSGELFKSLMESPSIAWHAERHQKAQAFMNRFVRQNIAEIDEIPYHNHTTKQDLPPAELALYLESESIFQSTEVRRKRKAIKGAEDRERRIAAAYGNSGSTEEALLKRCCYDELDHVKAARRGEDACVALCRFRKRERESCKKDIQQTLARARALRKRIKREDAEFIATHLDFWEKEVDAGDKEATLMLRKILKRRTSLRPLRSKADGDKQSKPKSAAERLKARKWELRELVVSGLVPLRKELVGRCRSLRFFEAVRAMQSHKGRLVEKCASCGRKIFRRSMGVLSCCGHKACMTCLKKHARDHDCPMEGCGAFVKQDFVKHSMKLRTHTANGDKPLSKIERVIEIINRAKPDERVLVFTQFADLEAKVSRVLKAHGVKSVRLQGTAHTKSGAVASFQQDKLKPGDARVLLLNVGDESASGINLTTASHAIFVHPLLTQSQEEYTAWQTQAVGRIRRYGQLRKCHVHHVIAKFTIDQKILLERKTLA